MHASSTSFSMLLKSGLLPGSKSPVTATYCFRFENDEGIGNSTRSSIPDRAIERLFTIHLLLPCIPQHRQLIALPWHDISVPIRGNPVPMASVSRAGLW